MFELCLEKCFILADRERVMRLMTSFNEPMVAPPHHQAQPTHAYICTFKEDEGFSVYIYLYLIIEKVGVLYRSADIFLTHEECRPAEDEGLQFAEDMGFMMDDLKFNELDPSHQDKLLAIIPLFSTTAPTERPLMVATEEVVETAEAAVEEAVVQKEVEEGKVEEKKKEEKAWEPEIFLSKFRMRAAAERMKKKT